MRRHLGAVLLLVVTFVAAGCNDDADPDEGTTPGATRVTVAPSSSDAGAHEYVEALAEGLVAQDAPMDERQARCFSDALLDVVGLERAQQVGSPIVLVEETRGLDFSPLEITRKEAEEVYEQLEVCGVDVRAAAVAEVTEGATRKQERCLARAATGDRVRDYYVTLMVQGSGPPSGDDSGDSSGGTDDGDEDGAEQGKSKKNKNKGPQGKSKKSDADKNDVRTLGDSPLMKAMVKCLR